MTEHIIGTNDASNNLNDTIHDTVNNSNNYTSTSSTNNNNNNSINIININSSVTMQNNENYANENDNANHDAAVDNDANEDAAGDLLAGDLNDYMDFVVQVENDTSPIQFTSAEVSFADVEDAIISDSTMKKYLPDLMHFFFWLLDNEVDTLTNHCISLLLDYKHSSRSKDIYKIVCESKLNFLSHLRASNEVPILVLDCMTPKIFMTYLIQIRNRTTKTFFGRSAYNSRRSALFHVFRLHNSIGFEPIFKLKLSHLFAGWFRWLAKEGRGDRKGRKKNAPIKKNLAWSQEDPKLPLSVEAYKAIAGWLLKEGTTESIFAHCFLVTTWNLACRSQNTANVRFGDISWNTSFDSYLVKFAHSKTDQTGEQSKYARHMFANPFLPTVCPVVALALHLSCNFNKIALDASTPLFPGKAQCDRFSGILERCLEDNKDQLRQEFGFDPSDIGTHSIRKGAATYLTSLPGGPSAAATCIRGGWTMGNIKDRYFRYSEAGDQFVGRCLALLNLLTVEFSCSPPMFVVEENSKLDKSINKVVTTQFAYASQVDGFALLCCMCTASLVFHQTWIVDHYPNSIVMNCMHMYKFANIKTFFEKNPNIVKVLFPWSDTQKHSFSGIPPHSALLNDLKALRSGQERILESMADKIKEALADVRVDGSAALTEKKLLECFDVLRVDMMAKFSTLESRQTTNENDNTNNNDDQLEINQEEINRKYDIHTFAGRLRRVPENWRIPKCGLFHLWHQWWMGDDNLHVAPLQIVVTKDVDFIDSLPLTKEELVGRRGGSLKRRPAGKQLSDMRYLINVMIQMVHEEGTFDHRITVETVDAMFMSIERQLLVRVRDIQKNWRSVVRELREKKVKVIDYSL